MTRRLIYIFFGVVAFSSPMAIHAETGASKDAAESITQSLEINGDYQTRFQSFTHFYAPTGQGAAVTNPSVFTHRLRLKPTFAFGDLAKISMDIEGLQGVLWGDNASLASTALFASTPSNTQLNGAEVPSLSLDRVWVEFKVPAGVMRVGRMPTQWGMGLLANDGDGFDNLFGDNLNKSTNDRILFATRPLAIAQKILGQEDSGIPLFFAVAYDHLVEDPLFDYNGHCVGNTQRGEPGYTARCDDDGDGVTESLDAVDETRLGADRSDSWWADGKDDVSEMVYVLVYKGEDIELFGARGDLTAGSYVVMRSQAETSSDVVIVDAYLKAAFNGLHFEFEGIRITGDTKAIPIPNNDLEGDIYSRSADISGYAARLGYEFGDFQAWLENGYASGDDNVFDGTFSGRALNPDHNVGLLLYEEILGRVSANNRLSEVLGSKGGVYNSIYAFPNLRYALNTNWQVIAAFLIAWPDSPDGDSIRCSREDTNPTCTELVERLDDDEIATSSHLGWEVDMALKGKFAGRMGLSLEAGVAQATDRIPLAKANLQTNELFYTVQLRLSYDLKM